MKTYRISKVNHGYESRSNANYMTGITIEDAQLEFDSLVRVYRKYGGSIVERTDDSLTVEDDNGENKITYYIYEE